MQLDDTKINEIHERGFVMVSDIIPQVEIPLFCALLEECIEEDLKQWEGKN